MDFLDVLYGGAAFSGGGGRGQQPSDNNNDARSGEHGMMLGVRVRVRAIVPCA